jgi:hypothetical protein
VRERERSQLMENKKSHNEEKGKVFFVENRTRIKDRE